MIIPMKNKPNPFRHGLCFGKGNRMDRETGVTTIRRTAVALLALLLAGTAGAAALDTIEKPRLKFRAKGPVCSCNSNLGEKEIQAALEARFSRQDDVTPPPGADRRTNRDEQKEGGNEKQP
mgnify:CR=1 FL=1